jgi:hypothetical protein
MSTINDRIQEFITTHELPDTDEFRESLADFVSGCWSDHFKIVMEKAIPDDKPAKGSKVSKENKIEDPTECKSREDLRNCTSGTLNEFCKKQGLRVGGNKTEIMDRVWRYLQGNNSEEDMSPRNKPKKEKKIKEKHDCYGCTSKGTPCAVDATVEVDGCWFCWRHEEHAQEIIEKKKGTSSVSKVSEKTSDKKKPKKKLIEDELKTDDSDNEVTKKTVSKKSASPPPAASAKGKGKKVKEPEPESEEEESEEEQEESDQQETDEDED